MSTSPGPDELNRLREQVAELTQRLEMRELAHVWEIRGKEDIINRLALRWERAIGVPSRMSDIPDNNAALRTALQRVLQLERELEGAHYTIYNLRRRQDGDCAMLRTLASLRDNLDQWVAHDARETAEAAAAAATVAARREDPPAPSFSTLDDAVPPPTMDEEV